MEELIAGKKRGISIIMDLVVNHCSSVTVVPKALADQMALIRITFILSKVTKNLNWES